MTCLYHTDDQIRELRRRVQAKEEPTFSAWRDFLPQANSALTERFHSVTDDGAPHFDGRPTSKHHFGVDRPIDPNEHREDATAVYHAAHTIRDLGIAYAFTQDSKYAVRAIDYLHHWCTSRTTYMMPLVRNYGPHRRTDVSAAYQNISLLVMVSEMAEGFGYLRGHPYWAGKTASLGSWMKWGADDLEASVAGWFREWEADAARDEFALPKGAVSNYHARYFLSRLACCIVAGKPTENVFQEGIARLKQHVNPGGLMVADHQRKGQGFHYSMESLEAWTRFARMADRAGVGDVWQVKEGQPEPEIVRALDYMVPFCTDPQPFKRWNSSGNGQPYTHTQEPMSPAEYKEHCAAYELAYSAYGKKEYLGVVQFHKRPMKSKVRSYPATLMFAREVLVAPAVPPKEPPPVVKPDVPVEDVIGETPPKADPIITFGATGGQGKATFTAQAPFRLRKFAFYVNKRKVGEVRRGRAESGVYTFEKLLAPGPYDVRADAIDATGKRIPSETLTVTVQ